jgi:two-component system cell cycle response regulator
VPLEERETGAQVLETSELFRVVIADDTPASRLLMRHILQESGTFQVVGEATDGQEAVELASRHQPDLVLVDLIMPRLDGVEAISRIRAVSPRSRIVVLSGISAADLARSPAGEVLRKVEGGVDGYVEKREPPEEVLRVVLEACRRKAAPAGQAGGAPSVLGVARGPAVGRPGARTAPAGAAPEAGEAAAALLERARGDLGLIGAAASHDLKSPLQAILGFAHLLDELYAEILDDRGRAFLHTIIDASERMASLVDGVASYCRAIATPPVAVPVALDQVLAGVLQSLEADINATGATVVAGPLPEVVGDPDQVVLVLSSLIASALGWAPANGRAPEIGISADRAPEGWAVSVTNRGPGVEAGHRKRAFAQFGRPSSIIARPAGEGSGPPVAGLAIAKRLVEGWGGSIWLEDLVGTAVGGPAGAEEPSGVQVRFVVPDRAPLAEGVEARPPAAARAHAPAVQIPPPRSPVTEADEPREEPAGESGGLLGSGVQQLLLVEDSEPHAHLVAATLAEAQGARYRLRHVQDLARARRALKEQRVDCVLLDLSLPDGEGLETLEQMVQMAPGIPVVVLTSRADEALAVCSVQQGAQDYLVKGAYEPTSLARSIRYAIERKALEAQLAQQALHDALTGLPNRTLLLERLNPALARASRTGDKLALLYLDLDGFKPINDDFGHDAGDAVLVEVARRLLSVVRPQDTVSRIGGDEFAAMCEGFHADTEIQSLVARMEDAIAQPIAIGHTGAVRRVTASIGIAFASGEITAEELIRSADQEMYRKKRRDL